MWAWLSELVGVFILLTIGLTFLRIADAIAAVLVAGLLFLLKMAGLGLLVLTVAFVVWSLLYGIFR